MVEINTEKDTIKIDTPLYINELKHIIVNGKDYYDENIKSLKFIVNAGDVVSLEIEYLPKKQE